MNSKLKKYFKTQFLKNKGSFVDLPLIDGIKISSSSANLYKKKSRNDLCLFYFENGASHAGVYTKSKVFAECIKCRRKNSSCYAFSFFKCIVGKRRSYNYCK